MTYRTSKSMLFCHKNQNNLNQAWDDNTLQRNYARAPARRAGPRAGTGPPPSALLPLFTALRIFERLRRSQVTTPAAMAAPPPRPVWLPRPARPVWPATQAAEAARGWPTEAGRDWFWPADSRDVLAELPLPPGPFDLDCPALCWRTLARNESPFPPLYQSTYIPLERVPDFVEGEAARGSAPFYVARSTKGALFDEVGYHRGTPRSNGMNMLIHKDLMLI